MTRLKRHRAPRRSMSAKCGAGLGISRPLRRALLFEGGRFDDCQDPEDRSVAVADLNHNASICVAIG